MGGKKQRVELRNEMRLVLERLDQRWIQAASHDLCRRLSQLLDSQEQQRTITKVLAWVSFFPGEVDLSSFISEQLPKREVYLPRIQTQGKMSFVAIDNQWNNDAETGLYGMQEPKEKDNRVYDLQSADETVVIVPGLAFDREGNRLGRGRHFYSNFLRPPMSRALKIGVGWSLQLVPKIPSSADETIMDWICHERGQLHTGIKFEEDI